MKRFAQLYAALDAQTSTAAKVEAMRAYFAEVPAADAAWAAYFLAGGKPRQAVPTAVLRDVACRRAGVAEWLFEACYQTVGDLAETIALVLPAPGSQSELGLAAWVEERLLSLRGLDPLMQAERLAAYWDELDTAERFLLVKLIGGGFRVGVSKLLVQRALALQAGLDAKQVAERMMGYTDGKVAPTPQAYRRLVSEAPEAGDPGQPYPFFLAHALGLPLDQFDAALGPPTDWLVEWKYDGIRAQLVKRAGRVWLWSRGEELLTERFPEVLVQAAALPDGTVLDGEILVWRDGRPSPFQLLQQRIGRKTLTKKVLADAPATLLVYDLLEAAGLDLRTQPQAVRRARLEALLASSALPVSPAVRGESWAALATLRQESRQRGVEGFMLKHHGSQYGSGRTKAQGTWWKWKIDPLSVDCVLIYAQSGHGRRASVYTDYTFAVWSRTPRDAAEAQAVVDAITQRQPAQDGALQLVPFAKAYSGLTDEEFRAVDRVIRQTTLEKFGPVRSVKPTLVFELGFEAIGPSPRHKSGLAVRFPRMLRIRDDKPLHEADTLQGLRALMDVAMAPGLGLGLGLEEGGG
jgi:DNA ligase-1